jgi:hypothetical protein
LIELSGVSEGERDPLDGKFELQLGGFRLQLVASVSRGAAENAFRPAAFVQRAGFSNKVFE